eukprot:5410730-Prymnesium_polylepis.1
MVAQVESAVAPEDAPLECIGAEHGRRGTHARQQGGGRGGAEQCDEGSRSREGAGWEHNGSMQPGAGGAGGRREQSG